MDDASCAKVKQAVNRGKTRWNLNNKEKPSWFQMYRANGITELQIFFKDHRPRVENFDRS